MALLKAVEVLNSGLFISYWRITHRQDDYNAGVVEVTLHGYRDADARHFGKEPLANLKFRFGPEDFGGSFLEVDLAALYVAVMASPDDSVLSGAAPV